MSRKSGVQGAQTSGEKEVEEVPEEAGSVEKVIVWGGMEEGLDNWAEEDTENLNHPELYSSKERQNKWLAT